MKPRLLLLATLASPLTLALACGGSAGSGAPGTASAAFDAAVPSYASLAMDQVASDTTAASAGPLAQALTAAPSVAGPGCHPHLFVREREVVTRLNRHLYKALAHVERVLARAALTSTDSSKTWEVVVDGIVRRFTVALVAPGVYTWALEVGPQGTSSLPVAMTGRIERAGAARPHEGVGDLHIDFAALHAGFPAERVSQGTLDVQFDVSAAARKIAVQAAGVAWELDRDQFPTDGTVAALSAPRSGAYVYAREPAKGGSLKIQDQMVFHCPANPSLKLADAQLVSRWYRLSSGAVHGRSDALLQGGQLPDVGVDRIVGVTCHDSGAEGESHAEGFWLMKAEDANGATLTGDSSETSDPTVSACDPVFGEVPTLADASKDFGGWPASYTDGVPFPFPGM